MRSRFTSAKRADFPQRRPLSFLIASALQVPIIKFQCSDHKIGFLPSRNRFRNEPRYSLVAKSRLFALVRLFLLHNGEDDFLRQLSVRLNSFILMACASDGVQSSHSIVSYIGSAAVLWRGRKAPRRDEKQSCRCPPCPEPAGSARSGGYTAEFVICCRAACSQFLIRTATLLTSAPVGSKLNPTADPAVLWLPASSYRQMPFRTVRLFLAANCCPP